MKGNPITERSQDESSILIELIWAAPREKVPNVLSRCHEIMYLVAYVHLSVWISDLSVCF